jgi:hypothetical protein
VGSLFAQRVCGNEKPPRGLGRDQAEMLIEEDARARGLNPFVKKLAVS